MTALSFGGAPGVAVLGGDLSQLCRRGGRWRLRDWRLRTKITAVLLVPLVLAGVAIILHGGQPPVAVVLSLVTLYTIGTREPQRTTLLTTAVGLYLYHTYDLVRVTGFHNGTPLIEFLSKGANFANLTGEKLSEYHVAQSMTEALHELDLTLTAYSLAPCWPNSDGAATGGDFEQPYYGLFIEQGDLPDLSRGHRLAERLDARLRQVNIEYASKRESQRLGSVRLELVPTGFWSQWDRARLLGTGGTLEKYKHPWLIADPHFRSRMTKEQVLLAGGS